MAIHWSEPPYTTRRPPYCSKVQFRGSGIRACRQATWWIQFAEVGVVSLNRCGLNDFFSLNVFSGCVLGKASTRLDILFKPLDASTERGLFSCFRGRPSSNEWSKVIACKCYYVQQVASTRRRAANTMKTNKANRYTAEASQTKSGGYLHTPTPHALPRSRFPGDYHANQNSVIFRGNVRPRPPVESATKTRHLGVFNRRTYDYRSEADGPSPTECARHKSRVENENEGESLRTHTTVTSLTSNPTPRSLITPRMPNRPTGKPAQIVGTPIRELSCAWIQISRSETVWKRTHQRESTPFPTRIQFEIICSPGQQSMAGGDNETQTHVGRCGGGQTAVPLLIGDPVTDRQVWGTRETDGHDGSRGSDDGAAKGPDE
ncbi:hypothetical protein FB45DRAFT_872629 [Roridomyces roridus]|uniref:Uncharacterized protein n=1 Tax=Roridomyces roridus TaxID=1738132 RepID=A0AAD7FDB1_9AGAR|nr:hypothetical protein FB45DRAFT_872629 [Roridomyces roridus]